MTQKEYIDMKAREVRAARNERLAETDYLLLPDYPLTDDQRFDILEYRRKLRDLPLHPSFPLVDLPQRPF